MVARGEADALLAGPVGAFERHLRHIENVIGTRPDLPDCATLQALVLDQGPLFLVDSHVTYDPSPQDVAITTLRAAEIVRRFGIEPKVALLSHSNFGSSDRPSAKKMRAALGIILANDAELEVDGEMHADAALSQVIRERILPTSRLKGAANLLVMPGLDAGNIAYNLLKSVTGAVSVGPILIGPRLPAHVVTASATTRGIVNMSTVAATEAIVAAQARG